MQTQSFTDPGNNTEDILGTKDAPFYFSSSKIEYAYYDDQVFEASAPFIDGVVVLDGKHYLPLSGPASESLVILAKGRLKQTVNRIAADKRSRERRTKKYESKKKQAARREKLLREAPLALRIKVKNNSGPGTLYITGKTSYLYRITPVSFSDASSSAVYRECLPGERRDVLAIYASKSSGYPVIRTVKELRLKEITDEEWAAVLSHADKRQKTKRRVKEKSGQGRSFGHSA